MLFSGSDINQGKKRDYQEDACEIEVIKYKKKDQKTVVVNFLILADGMGGHASGDVASKTFIEVCKQSIKNISKNDLNDWNSFIRRTIDSANREIFSKAENENKKGMGCTGILCVIDGCNLFGGWIGDSRIYLYTDKKLRQISRDHSYLQQLLDAGKLTDEEAESFTAKNVITRAVGIDPEKGDPDLLSQESIILGKKDTVFICSDGLSGEVSDSQLENILQEELAQWSTKNIEQKKKIPNNICKLLTRVANDNGGGDNISVVMAICDNDNSPSGFKREEPRKVDKIKSSPEMNRRLSNDNQENKSVVKDVNFNKILLGGIAILIILFFSFLYIVFSEKNDGSVVKDNKNDTAQVGGLDEAESQLKERGKEQVESEKEKNKEQVKSDRKPSKRTSPKTSPKTSVDSNVSTEVAKELKNAKDEEKIAESEKNKAIKFQKEKKKDEATEAATNARTAADKAQTAATNAKAAADNEEDSEKKDANDKAVKDAGKAAKAAEEAATAAEKAANETVSSI